MHFDPEYARKVRGFYVPFFEGCESVLDIATGRGEFLGLMREAGIGAVGVDLDPLMVKAARTAAYEVAEADVFDYLRGRENAFDGVFSAHFIEHLPSERVVELFGLCGRALRPGGRLVLCTPNPASLPTLQRQFWWDATHVRMYDVELLRFFAAGAGFTDVEGGVNPLNDPGCPIDLAALQPPPLRRLPARGRLAAALGLRRLDQRTQEMHHHLKVLSDSLAGLVRELYAPSEIYIRGIKP